MKIKPFKLERYFSRYEFSAEHILCASDCETLTLNELLSLTDDDSAKLWGNLRLGYTDSQGHPILRSEIAKLYNHINPDDVLVITPEEGIFIAMNVLLNKGDHVITTFPGYQSLYQVADSLGCEIGQWNPKQKESWHFDTADLKALIRSNTKLIVINFPHNPTGALITKTELDEIINLAREKNIYLFSDEMYRYLEYDDTDRLPSVCDLYQKALSLFGLSKTFGLPGLRIGWLTTQNKILLKELTTFKDYTTICSSAPSEVLSIIALRAKNKIITRNIKMITDNLSLLDDFFVKHDSLFKLNKPKAGPVAFPELKPTIDIEKFCVNLVEREGVMLLPSTVYDFPGNYFRIGLGRKNMSEGLKKLENYLTTVKSL